MVEEDLRRGFGPLLAVLSSNGAERITGKNNLTFAQLLLPFCYVNSDLKEPAGTTVPARLIFDVRDIRYEGFLLTLTVLPSVLHESVQTAASTSDASDVFRETLLRWAEPSEHEFLRTYIACLFAVSTEDTDPLNELSQLVQMQHSQQHGVSSSSAIGPAYCVHPKWMLPNTYKYHILVHDVTSGDETRAVEIFNSMCSVYGAENCYLLRLNSGTSDGLEDVWKPELERKNCGLESGLARARKNILFKAASSMEMGSSEHILNQQLTLNDSVQESNSAHMKSYGSNLNATDREEISAMIRTFNTSALTPFVERQLRIMNEQIAARRGISRSLTTGVRKWFGAATIQSANTATVSYSLESSEMQTRRLADLYFVFGLYTYAYQLYQGLKKTFAVDQAWLHHAGALEMAAIAFFLSNPQTPVKQYSQHYMENAINHYTTTCMRPILAMRAALISASILEVMKLHVEAAGQLLKLTNLDNDLFAGILLERCSVAFGNAKMSRKMAFHYVLAGHRFFKANQEKLALECYKTALTEYEHKRWLFAEDHILYILARDNRYTDAALEYSKQLFRPLDIHYEEQQQQFLSRLLELLVKTRCSNGLPLTFPANIIIAKLVYVIYGGLSEQVTAELVKEAIDEENILPSWKGLEKAAFQYFYGSSRKFIPVPSVTDASADYSNARLAPLNENLRIRLALKSFLGFAITLKRLSLSVGGDSLGLEKSFIDEVTLKPHSDWVEIESGVVPRRESPNIRINGISFDIEHCGDTLNCEILLTAASGKSSERNEVDHSRSECRCIYSKTLSLPHPLFRAELASFRHLSAFCGQIYCVEFDVCNEGSITIQDLCLVTNRPSMVSLFEPVYSYQDEVSWELSKYQLSSTDRNVLIFHPKLGNLSVGEKKKLRIAFRAPLDEVINFPLSLMFYCTADNGMCRQERHLISFDTHPLLEASFSSANDVGDLCLLHLHNLISTRDSLLAKIELLGIRRIKASSTSTSTLCAKQNICLKLLRNRSVFLECEQLDNLCFTVSTSTYSLSESVVWFNGPSSGFPTWPVVPILAGLQSSTSSVPQVAKPSCQFGILWKANIVNTDGTIANVLGENIIEYSYKPWVAVSLPDSLSSLSLFEKTISTNRFDEVCSEEEDTQHDSSPLICSVKCATSTIVHDFLKERFCQFPIEVSVTNNERMQRHCDLILQCITPGESSSFANGSFSQHGDHRPFSSTVSLVPSVTSMQFSQTTTQPLIISSCARIHASLPFGSTHIFKLRLSVATPSVYNVTCFELSAQFKGSPKPFRITLPYTFVAVINKRGKDGRDA